MVKTGIIQGKRIDILTFVSFLVVITAMVLLFGTTQVAFAEESAGTQNSGIQLSQNATDESQYQDNNSDKLRDKQGVVSQLNTTTHNPYNKLITVRIDIGSEFAEFDGSENTEAIVIKCNPGDYIDLPKVKAKPGYTFIGWNQGGVGEPMWTPDVTTVQMTTDASGGKSTVIDAIYMNDKGDGYCTCGAWVEGYFENDIEHYKSVYEEYLKTSGYNDGSGTATADKQELPLPLLVAIGIAVIALLLIVVFVVRKRKSNGKNEDSVRLGQHGRMPNEHRPVASDEQIAVYDSLHPDLRPAVDFVAAIEAASRNARK